MFSGAVGLGTRRLPRISRPAVLAVAVPLLIFLIATTGPVLTSLLLVLLIFATFIGISSRYPEFSVLGLVVWVPVQIPVLAYAYKLGAPTVLVKDIGYLKEFWAISLVITVIRSGGLRRRLDRLDWAVVTVVGVAALYLFVPFVGGGVLGNVPFWPRLTAWRLDVLGLVIFFSVRRINFSRLAPDRIRYGVYFVAVVLAGFGFWESSDSGAFTTFIGGTLAYPVFKAAVLGVTVKGPVLIYGSAGNSSFVRAGSLLNDPATFGFLMLIPLGLGLERLGARKGAVLGGVVAGISVAAVTLTVTRAAVLGASAVIVLAVLMGVSRLAPSRARVMVVVLLAGVLLLPSAGHSNVVGRFESIFNTQDSDTQGHVASTRAAASQLLAHPLGRGLGSSTAIGTRFGTSNVLTAENSYLELGNELGLAGMLAFIAVLLMALQRLRQRSREETETASLAGALWLAGWGLFFGGMFLQTWTIITVTLMFWPLAGIALSITDDEARPPRHRWRSRHQDQATSTQRLEQADSPHPGRIALT